MKLKEIIENVTVVSINGATDVVITALTYDSRQVVRGTLFFAVKGIQSDGHDFIDGAIVAGAVCVVCESLPEELKSEVTYILVEDSNKAIGGIAANFYDNPSQKLQLVGITGTNGKTTTATLLYDTFRALGYKTGLISTVVYRIHDLEIASTHTTPDAIRLNQMMAQMVDAGCQYCFMEVSSHSIVQHRIEGIHFVGGIFTNITHDHLDYHHTFAEYIRAKKQFFDNLPSTAFALINVDDRNGRVMVQNCKAQIKTYSMTSGADFKCRIVEMLFDGMLLNVDSSEVWVRFLGRFNAYNLLSVYAASLLLGVDRNQLLTIISSLTPVNGRFEYLRSPLGITAIVDYAHTPDALQNVLDTIAEIRTGGSKLYVVVGCGGNRDAAKRPVMAAIAAKNSDLAILTSDNPRKENPESILSDMKVGVIDGSRYLAITDRREAIKTAVAMAKQGDIILVAGKGHETYQDVMGVKYHFDDKEEIAKIFNIN